MESSTGNGAKFSFHLKLKGQEKEAEFKANLHRKNQKEKLGNLENPKHVLIVDDNKINQKITQKTLSKYQIESTLADNGEDAIQLAKENTYDLILMDIHMPKMNGIEATKNIRTFNTIVPIIALTAVEMDENKSEILDSGINDIVHKPYNLTVFLDLIFNYLQTEKVNEPG